MSSNKVFDLKLSNLDLELAAEACNLVIRLGARGAFGETDPDAQRAFQETETRIRALLRHGYKIRGWDFSKQAER